MDMDKTIHSRTVTKLPLERHVQVQNFGDMAETLNFFCPQS